MASSASTECVLKREREMVTHAQRHQTDKTAQGYCILGFLSINFAYWDNSMKVYALKKCKGVFRIISPAPLKYDMCVYIAQLHVATTHKKQASCCCLSYIVNASQLR